MSDKVPVDLSGAAQTMLTTLYLKALDADFERPVLGDRYAKNAIRRLDYDWQGLGVTGKWAPLITIRTAQYDIWARQCMAVHESLTVVHLGCGMDSRVFRLNPGPNVEWYDVDYPAVIALREKVYPARHHYHLIAASATDASWLGDIPVDRPVLMLAEGISMYLTKDEGVALLRRVVDTFPAGEIQMDFYNWLAIRSQRWQTLVRRSGATLHWAVNTSDDVLREVTGLRLLAAVSIFDADTLALASNGFKFAERVARLAPRARKTLQYHRYAFGSVADSPALTRRAGND